MFCSYFEGDHVYSANIGSNILNFLRYDFFWVQKAELFAHFCIPVSIFWHASCRID